jgi:hypothetical protein
MPQHISPSMSILANTELRGVANPRIVPIGLYPFLDHTTATLWSPHDHLFEFIRHTYRLRIHYIGSLIQIPEKTVFRIAPVESQVHTEVVRRLEANGLEFGMAAPGWFSPDDRPDPTASH